MRTSIKMMAVVMTLIITSCSTTKTTPETINEVKTKVSTQNFKINVNKAIPLRMRPVYLTSAYDFTLKGDSAFAYLPYYGVAQSAPYGSTEGGIKFAEPISEYKYTENSKKRYHNISFKVQSGAYNYQVRIDVFENGNTTLNINSYQRDGITFYGEMVLDK